MSKKKISNKRKYMMRHGQLLKISVAVFLLVIAVTVFFTFHKGNVTENGDKVTGVWISYGDFDTLGLYNQNEEDFRANAETFFDYAQKYGINTVYFHVRAFRDAAYDSEIFPVSAYIWDRDEEIRYDPLKIMVEIAHDHGMELHAWMNPYRNTSFEQEILDPAAEATIEEILLCVGEVVDNYNVDGIHFDDYFYEEGNDLPEADKKENVNRMVKAVYSRVHNAGRNLVFGISPAGNTAYCESIGADIETWLSEDGYVDYIIPQIYWTDQHTATWRDKMFTDTLDEWININKSDKEMYIGLALYKAGLKDEADPGWQKSQENLASQVQRIQETSCDGFVFFSASDLYRASAEKELNNYRDLVF